MAEIRIEGVRKIYGGPEARERDGERRHRPDDAAEGVHLQEVSPGRAMVAE